MRPDDRFAQLRHQDEEVDEQVAAAEALQRAVVAVEARQVGARAEHPPGPVRTTTRTSGSCRHQPKRRREVAQHLAGKGVALLGAVQRDRGDMAIDGEKDLF